MASFNPVLRISDAEIPVKDGNFIVDIRPGQEKFQVDFDGVRYTIMQGTKTKDEPKSFIEQFTKIEEIANRFSQFWPTERPEY